MKDDLSTVMLVQSLQSRQMACRAPPKLYMRAIIAAKKPS
jgi:hypothetical protein